LNAGLWRANSRKRPAKSLCGSGCYL